MVKLYMRYLIVTARVLRTEVVTGDLLFLPVLFQAVYSIKKIKIKILKYLKMKETKFRATCCKMKR